MKSRRRALWFYVLLGVVGCWAQSSAHAATVAVAVTDEPAGARRSANPLFWRAEGPEGAQLFLLGSVHVGQPAFYPLGGTIEQAFRRADTLVVELDIVDLDHTAVARTVAALGLYAPGSTDISSSLPPDLHAKLSGYCERFVGVCPAADVRARMKPWLLSLHITQQLINAGQYRSEYGVDRYFLNRRGEKAVVALETFEDQAQSFAQLPMATQAVLLEQTLLTPHASMQAVEALVGAWRAGDAAGLAKAVLEPMQSSQAALPLYEALILKRNRQMAKQLLALGTPGRQVFVVVGAGHLIGAHGLPRLLATQGFKLSAL
ncbi:TraB/GumN family protein [Simiduia sp. 21SJ11W-1]|uniref:TraB/GumN family protein n=1 Tax=Simiduia sp. 21SJ11W-1 TaxID=2909669 RepID=UPI0020A1E4B5|nr:TraB/GumN family protein [Simiduia sp. 21SJ11W-1]UTA46445.1 TraB/GumN family protein [Simiduia sp. 21SJ11W-1]